MGWAIAYDILMASCCGYALLKGGAPERAGAAIMLVASFATWGALILFGDRHGSLERGILAVDLVALAALVALALAADRFWPMFAAGFHLVGVSVHGAIFVNAPVAPLAYAHALGLWSYLTLACLAIGTHQLVRRRRRAEPISLPKAAAPQP